MAEPQEEPCKPSMTELSENKNKEVIASKKVRVSKIEDQVDHNSETASDDASGSSGQERAHLDMSALAHICGVWPLVKKKPENGKVRTFTRIEALVESLSGQKVWIRGRVHILRKFCTKICFVVVRQRCATVQTIVEGSESVPRMMVKWISKLREEAIVDMYGTIMKVTQPTATSQSDVELKIEKCFLVADVSGPLPLRVQDASVPQQLLDEQRQQLKVLNGMLEAAHTRLAAERDAIAKKEIKAVIAQLENDKLRAAKYPDVAPNFDHRVIDLRTVANQAIFMIQSGVVNLFRDFLNANGFNEIHSPKLISNASVEGSEVFEVTYFDRKAYLTQSPQLYKQMAISADFERVYEIGPVFRAENACSARHVTEFTSMDLEMQIYEHYHEVLEVLGDLFVHIFKGIETRYPRELEAVQQQYPFRPLKYLEKTLRLEWPEAIALLRSAGATIGDLEAINLEHEFMLGRAVYEKYGTDFYIVDQFPTYLRPFYSMVNSENPTFANAYDLYIRGQEVCSGAQRVHDSEFLVQRATDQGTDPDAIKDCVDALRYAAPPHGGGGIGLDRLVMLYFGFSNIRKSSMFPRDSHRLTP